jgi:divalent metal cation (Fe/Co/Zn/Cd) transporter
MRIIFLIKEYLLFSYGYSNMTYISSLISGVGIFCFGTGLAWYHGVLVLLHPQEMESIFWVKKSKENLDLF